MTAARGTELFKFRLYLATDAPNSDLARANLAAFCARHLPGRHEIDLIDFFLDPRRALADGVSMAPTLVKLSPAPLRRIIGSLSQAPVLFAALGLGVLPT